MSKVKFSESEVKEIQMAAKNTWNYIGYDILTALAEQGESDTVPVQDVIELVLDADYMVTANRNLDKSLHQRFKSLTYTEQQKLIRPAFPFRRYGM